MQAVLNTLFGHTSRIEERVILVTDGFIRAAKALVEKMLSMPVERAGLPSTTAHETIDLVNPPEVMHRRRCYFDELHQYIAHHGPARL